ncbi:MAG: ATP phosphoribosyltransferase regulatory subunit [Rhizobiaceae bacterium]
MPDILTQLRSVAPDALDIPILQPADPFLETAGEDLRRRIFITESADGALNCLRPEFTIPICRGHIGNGAARYSYQGTVFRQGREGSAEFVQAGLEDIGHGDRVAADTACLGDMLVVLKAQGAAIVRVVFGDDIFKTLIEELSLPATVSARLQRSFGQRDRLKALIGQMTAEAGRGLREDESEDITSLTRQVEGMMAMAGISPSSGRSPADIAARMAAKSTLAHYRLSKPHERVLRDYLSIRTPLADAADQIEVFAEQHGMNLRTRLDRLRRRVRAMESRGIDLSTITFDAGFGRKLEYYTGMQFEVFVGGVAVGGGGRYDHLFALLGQGGDGAGVGFSIAMDRLAEATQ